MEIRHILYVLILHGMSIIYCTDDKINPALSLAPSDSVAHDLSEMVQGPLSPLVRKSLDEKLSLRPAGSVAQELEYMSEHLSPFLGTDHGTTPLDSHVNDHNTSPVSPIKRQSSMRRGHGTSPFTAVCVQVIIGR